MLESKIYNREASSERMSHYSFDRTRGGHCWAASDAHVSPQNLALTMSSRALADLIAIAVGFSKSD
jgi:hypothetical protein